MPRYAILVIASPTTEGKGTPSPGTLAAIGKFNEEMNAAGVLLAGEGLRPTAHGYRVRFTAGADDVAVSAGSFDLAEQSTVSGWWVIRVKDAEEALGWAKRIPFKGNAEVEVRLVSEVDDFNMTEEEKEREEKLRAAVEGKE